MAGAPSSIRAARRMIQGARAMGRVIASKEAGAELVDLIPARPPGEARQHQTGVKLRSVTLLPDRFCTHPGRFSLD